MSPESWRLCPPLAFIHNSSAQRSFQKVHVLPMLDHPEPRLVLAVSPTAPVQLELGALSLALSAQFASPGP